MVCLRTDLHSKSLITIIWAISTVSVSAANDGRPQWSSKKSQVVEFRTQVSRIISEFEDQDRKLEALETADPDPHWTFKRHFGRITDVCKEIHRTIGEIAAVSPVPSTCRPTYELLQKYGKESKGLIYDYEEGSKGGGNVDLLVSGWIAGKSRR